MKQIILLATALMLSACASSNTQLDIKNNLSHSSHSNVNNQCQSHLNEVDNLLKTSPKKVQKTVKFNGKNQQMNLHIWEYNFPSNLNSCNSLIYAKKDELIKKGYQVIDTKLKNNSTHFLITAQ